MIHWTPTKLNRPALQWKSRQEILQTHLDSLSPDELRRVRPGYYWLRFGQEALLRNTSNKKFDPDQPRVPAGHPDGGQWTADGGGVAPGADFSPAPYELAAVGQRKSAAYCWNQMLIDFVYCGAVRSRRRAAACRSQAMERYAACLVGKPIPPLPF